MEQSEIMRLAAEMAELEYIASEMDNANLQVGERVQNVGFDGLSHEAMDRRLILQDYMLTRVPASVVEIAELLRVVHAVQLMEAGSAAIDEQRNLRTSRALAACHHAATALAPEAAQIERPADYGAMMSWIGAVSEARAELAKAETALVAESVARAA